MFDLYATTYCPSINGSSSLIEFNNTCFTDLLERKCRDKDEIFH